MLGRRDPEAGVERQLGDARAPARRGRRAPGESAARAPVVPGDRDEVEPAVGALGRERDPLVGRGRATSWTRAELGLLARRGGRRRSGSSRPPPARRPRTAPSRRPRGATRTSSARAACRRAPRASRPGLEARVGAHARRERALGRRGGSPARRRAGRRTGSRARSGRRRPRPPPRRARASPARPSGRSTSVFASSCGRASDLGSRSLSPRPTGRRADSSRVELRAGARARAAARARG